MYSLWEKLATFWNDGPGHCRQSQGWFLMRCPGFARGRVIIVGHHSNLKYPTPARTCLALSISDLPFVNSKMSLLVWLWCVRMQHGLVWCTAHWNSEGVAFCHWEVTQPACSVAKQDSQSCFISSWHSWVSANIWYFMENSCSYGDGK